MTRGLKVEKHKVGTGVISLSSLSFEVSDVIYNGIDIDFEEHLKVCENEEHDGCYNVDSPTYFSGMKKNESGEYVVNPEAEFSFIFNSDTNNLQIVNSKFALPCKLCSPCYPNQGDLDSDGDEVIAFCLPLQYYIEDDDDYERVESRMLKVVESLNDFCEKGGVK